MANIIDKTPTNVYVKPSPRECQEMNWGWGYIPEVASGYNAPCRDWIRNNVWCWDYVINDYGIVFFKHDRDLIMFRLKWAR